MWRVIAGSSRALGRYRGVPKMMSCAPNSSPEAIKPPNVLIYQSEKDPTNLEFLRTKESLEFSLTPERYVIYPLGVDDIRYYSPWKDNCKLLVVPPSSEQVCKSGAAAMPPVVVEEVIMYVLSGGQLLSMDSDLNRHFGLLSLQEALHRESGEPVKEDKQLLTVYCRDGVCDVETNGSDTETSCRFSCLVPPRSKQGSSKDVYLRGVSLQDSVVVSRDRAYFSPVEWNADMEWIDQNTNQNNNTVQSNPTLHSTDLPSIPCVRQIEFRNGGSAVLASTDLRSVLPQGLNISPLVRLKKGVALRESFTTEQLRIFGLECSSEQLPSLTHTYLICSEEHRSQFFSGLKPHLLDAAIPGKDISIRFLTHDYNLGTPVDDTAQPSLSELTIITNPAPWQLNNLPFSVDRYFEELQTRELGRTLLHTPVITSTQLPFMNNMTFCQALRPEMGVAWVAAQQTKGKGRSGNAWISPRGSMMFSMPLQLLPEGRLSHHLPLLQHIVAVAVVHGVRSQEGYKDLPLRIKWPNDIYYESKVKLGGILVSCMSLGNNSNTAVIGCGVNINNQYPTMSVNDVISLHNRHQGSTLAPISVETVLAWTLTTLERLLTIYEVQGEEPILTLYYKYWLHGGAQVSLASHEEEQVEVVGLDKYGYLRVQRTGGDELSLQPDGNSFDIMKGLIIMKN